MATSIVVALILAALAITAGLSLRKRSRASQQQPSPKPLPLSNQAITSGPATPPHQTSLILVESALANRSEAHIPDVAQMQEPPQAPTCADRATPESPTQKINDIPSAPSATSEIEKTTTKPHDQAPAVQETCGEPETMRQPDAGESQHPKAPRTPGVATLPERETQNVANHTPAEQPAHPDQPTEPQSQTTCASIASPAPALAEPPPRTQQEGLSDKDAAGIRDPKAADNQAPSQPLVAPVDQPSRKRHERIITLRPAEDTITRRRALVTTPTRTPSNRTHKVFDPPDITEYINSNPAFYAPPTWDEYRKWNRAVASFFLVNSRPKCQAVLPITPRLLAAAWQKSEGETLTPDQAATALSKSVGALYAHELVPHRDGLKTLKTTAPDEIPLCTAFLSLAVLAAYSMQTEGGYSANAYYSRLLDLLLRGHAKTESLPFNQDDYYALWAYLQNWVRQKTGACLALPDRNESGKFYVDLALSHVPLRKVDVDRLSTFFLFADYGPGEKPPPYELDVALAHWCTGSQRLTKPGMEALADARRPAVISQVAHELEVWDGAARSERGQTVANVELLLEFPNRRATLALLPKCPDGFPHQLEAHGQMLLSTGGGWYQPLPIQATDGPTLQQGFIWECASPHVDLALRRPPATVIPLVTKDSQEHGSALMSSSGLLLGVKCAVMCVDALAPLVEQYLSKVTGAACRPIKPQSFPHGWVLFTGINARTPVTPPPGLEALSPDSTIRILCSGGLRVANAYLNGAPPTILVSGTPAARPPVSIDGNAVDLDMDGFIKDSSRILTKGSHIIKAGPKAKTIEIVQSDLAHALTVAPNLHSAGRQHKVRTRVALPPGIWQVLGARIGEIGQIHSVSRQGIIFDCPFPPVWAVCCESRRKPRVICLVPQPQEPEMPSRKLLAKITANKKIRLLAGRWACVIRFANHPRLQVADAVGKQAHPPTVHLWHAFKHSAAEVARTLRRL